MSDLPTNADWIAPPSSEPPAAHPIALNDILVLQVRIHWAEAVAVIEELCALLVSEDASAVWVPDVQDVLITVHGTVMIRRGAAGTEDIDDLGRMLHALLDSSDTPMPIRLFIAHSIGSGKFTTIGDYAEALAYYGRPGRDELIQALYQRCLESPLPDVPLAPEPLLEDEPTEAEPPRPGRRIRTVAAAIGLLVVAAGIAAIWLWGVDSRVTASASRLKKAVSEVAATTAERFGWTTSASTPEAAAADASQRPPARRGARSRVAPSGVTAGPDILSDGGINPAPLLELPPGGTQGSQVIEGGFAAPPAPELPRTARAVDSTIYSSASAGVQPPVMYLPKLPPVPPVSPDLPGTNTMELLIDEDGLVQEAKLVSQPVRLPDMMLLSGAKTWRFYPAMKDGRPVKYRLALSWIVTPP